jgi:hypothetical protein
MAEVPPPVVYSEPPTLVTVDAGVWVIRDSDYPVYRVGDYYWAYRDNVWYRSPTYDRGWIVVRAGVVPPTIVHRDHLRYVHYRGPATAETRPAPASPGAAYPRQPGRGFGGPASAGATSPAPPGNATRTPAPGASPPRAYVETAPRQPSAAVVARPEESNTGMDRAANARPMTPASTPPVATASPRPVTTTTTRPVTTPGARPATTPSVRPNPNVESRRPATTTRKADTKH